MCMHSGFPAGRSEQTIMTSLCDITRISQAKKGVNYKKESMTKHWGCHSCCLGVPVLNNLGLLASHRPSTSAVSVSL